MPNESDLSLPVWKSGDPLLASQLNQIVNAIAQRIIGDGSSVKVRVFGNQLVISAFREQITPTILHQMRIQSDQGDYLICRSVDALGAVGTSDINVIKPWTLRRTPFEGLTVNSVAYTYSANGTREADESETQNITQDYFAGAIIYVMQMNLTVEVTTGVFVSLIDANVDARQWCEPE